MNAVLEHSGTHKVEDPDVVLVMNAVMEVSQIGWQAYRTKRILEQALGRLASIERLYSQAMEHICETHDQAHRLYFNAGGKPTALETMLFENGMLGYYAGVKMGSEMARRSVEGLTYVQELVHMGLRVDMPRGGVP